MLIPHLKNETKSRQSWLLVTGALMSPGTASHHPGPEAWGQEEMGLESKTTFPEIFLGEVMVAGLKWSLGP